MMNLEIVITQMRADYHRVVGYLCTQVPLTEAAIAEYADTFKAAIDSGDVERINAAAAHLAAMVAPIDARHKLFVEMEKRMRQKTKGVE